MKHIIDEIHVRGRKNDQIVVPTMKQTEENTTNIQIECKFGNHYCHSRTYLRIIDVFDMYEGITTVRGYCCYNCANGFKPNSMVALICSHGRRYSPGLVRANNPSVFFNDVVDSTKNRIDEIEKHRERRKRYIKRMKDSGILAIHKPKKIRVGTSTTAPRTDDDWWKMLDKVSKNV